MQICLNSHVWLVAAAVLDAQMWVCPSEGGWVFHPCASTARPGPREYRGYSTEFTCTQPKTGAHLPGLYPARDPTVRPDELVWVSAHLCRCTRSE